MIGRYVSNMIVNMELCFLNEGMKKEEFGIFEQKERMETIELLTWRHCSIQLRAEVIVCIWTCV